MKKLLASVMAVAMLASMGMGAFADYAPAAHTHNFKVVERYTSEDYCWATGGTHIGTWVVRRCSCGLETQTNTKNSCGRCPTGGSVRELE